MADVVVVGAGLGGLACAARLAKLGHTVTVLERTDEPGGLLRQLRRDDFVWDAHPLQITLPAVLRDLFRKSGRPIERYLELEHASPARRHCLPDGSVVDLPTGSRAAQQAALAEVWGDRPAESWISFVDDQADRWNLLRASVLDVPTGAAVLSDRKQRSALQLDKSLERLARKAFRDSRLRSLATFPADRRGLAPKSAPALLAVETYVERTFGVWQAPSGAADLARILLERLTERKVDLRYGCEATGLTGSRAAVTGVMLADGRDIPADIVVAAVNPLQVYGSAITPPALISRTYLGLSDAQRGLPREIVLHGDPLAVVFTGNSLHPRAWTVELPTGFEGDVPALLAGRGLEVRNHLAVSLRPSPDTPPTWSGPHRDRQAGLDPMPGLYCLGTTTPVLGRSIPYVAWEAAHVATLSTPDGAIRPGVDRDRRKPSST